MMMMMMMMMIYRGWAQINSTVQYHIAFEVLVNNLFNTFFSELLRCLIAFQLLLKHVEDVSEEACDADGIYMW